MQYSKTMFLWFSSSFCGLIDPCRVGVPLTGLGSGFSSGSGRDSTGYVPYGGSKMSSSGDRERKTRVIHLDQ